VTEPSRLDVLVHELRSPVAALEAVVETLVSRGDSLPPTERRRLVGLAVAAAGDVERLLDDPDLFSVREEPVAVDALLAGLEGVRVEGAPGLVVRGDPVRLRQAIDNLVANALRHGDSVTVRGGVSGNSVLIAVSDDGPGVQQGLDVFAPGTSGVDSTGLGLYVTRQIAEAHGGAVELESAPGQGATFTLVLPSASGLRD
jgi:signal transduction histidine kinase